MTLADAEQQRSPQLAPPPVAPRAPRAPAEPDYVREDRALTKEADRVAAQSIREADRANRKAAADALKPAPEPEDVPVLRKTKSRMAEVEGYHKKALADFDSKAGRLIADKPDDEGNGGELNSIDDLEAEAADTVGALKGAFTPGVSAGDPSDKAKAARVRLGQILQRARELNPQVSGISGAKTYREALKQERARLTEQQERAKAARTTAELAYGKRISELYGLPPADLDPEVAQSLVPDPVGNVEKAVAEGRAKPEQVGTLRGIVNAAQNAFDSSRQALTVMNGLDENDAAELARLEYNKAARASAPGYDAYQRAEGWDAVKAFAENPVEVASNIVAEGLAGSLPVIASGLGTGAAGAGTAALAGTIVPGAGNVIGAAGGFTAGMIAGTGAGSFAVEYGGKILEELQAAGMDLQNPESIAEFFSNEQLLSAAKEKAVKRGVPVAAFDALSAGIAGRVGSVVRAAAASPVRLAAAEAITQGAAGGLGEVAGALAAGDEVSGKGVFGEIIGEVGPGAVEVAAGRIAAGRSAPEANGKPVAATPSPTAPAPEATGPMDEAADPFFTPEVDDELAAEMGATQSTAGTVETQAAATESAPAAPVPISSAPVDPVPPEPAQGDVRAETPAPSGADTLSQEPPVGDVAAPTVNTPEQKPTPAGSTPALATTREPALAQPEALGEAQPVGGEAPAPDFKLPGDLAGAKPRYSYGAKQFDLRFDSDLDKALYVLAQDTPSKRDADYLRTVTEATGLTEAQARNMGKALRSRIKTRAKDAQAGELTVPVFEPARDFAARRASAQPSSNVVAQSAEQRTPTPQVAGSTPADVATLPAANPNAGQAVSSPEGNSQQAPPSQPPAATSDQPQDTTAPTPAPAPAAGQTSKKLVLWGRRDGGPWVKLSDNTSNAEQARRRKDGWETATYAKGDDANNLSAPTKQPAEAAPAPRIRKSRTTEPAAESAPTSAPLIARGANTPAEFVRAVATAGGVQAGSKPVAVLAEFARRLNVASPEGFRGMEIRAYDEDTWKADPATRRNTPDSSAAYSPETNTLYLRTDRIRDERALVSAIVHEAGHFAETFALPEALIAREWAKLTDAQIEQAARDYDANDDRYPKDIRKDKRARSEWVAQQFARVVTGRTEGMAPAIREGLKKFLADLKALVTKWLGSDAPSSAALDAEILRVMGFTEEAKPVSATPSAEATPSPAPSAPSPSRPAPGGVTTPGAVAERIREDLPEAKPIIDRINELGRIAQSRKDALSAKPGEVVGQVQQLTNALDFLTESEKEEMQRLKTQLRPKSAAEAAADVKRKREARKAKQGELDILGTPAEPTPDSDPVPLTDAEKDAAQRELSGERAALNPPKNAPVPDQPGKRFRSHTDTLIERGYEATRTTYETKPNATTKEAAAAFIAAAGEGVAAAEVFNKDSELSGAVRVAMGIELERRLNARRTDASLTPEQRTEAAAQFTRFSERLATLATESGQTVQAFNLVEDIFSEEGALHSATQQAQQRQDRMIGENGRETEKEIVDAMNAENAKVIDSLLKDVKADVRKIRVSKKMVERAVGEVPKTKKGLDAAIKQAFDDAGKSVNDILRTHFTQVDAIGTSLVEKLKQEAGLSDAEAQKLDEAVRTRLAQKTDAAKRRVLDRLSKTKGGVSRRMFTLIDKIVEMSNAGALDRPALRERIAEELKLPRVTDALVKRLKELTEKRTQTPEGFQRDRVDTDILTELRKVEGIGKIDIATAIYYAHILSGYTTQLVNIVSTAMNTAADVTLTVANAEADALLRRNGAKLGTPTAQALSGMMAGARQGWASALATLDTGYANKAFGEKLPDVAPVLEILSREPATGAGKLVKGYATLLRYITRSMKAADSVFYRSASEAFQRVAAAKIAGAMDGGSLDRAEANRRIRDLLAMSPADFERARRDARAEGLTGYDYDLRVGELVEQGRNPELVADASRSALESTFNSHPRGALGIIADAVGKTAQKIPALKLFVPFTNIVANVTNASLNYSPLGIARAARGYAGEKAMTQDERARKGIPELARERALLNAKAFAGTTAMVSLLAYALSGDEDEPPFITANGPKDIDRRNQLRQSGWKPHSIKVGDVYVSYLASPMAVPLAFVGNWADGVRYNDLGKGDTVTNAAQAFVGIGSTITEMSFLSGVADLFDTLRGKPGASPEKWLGNVATSAVVPNLVRQLDRTFDPTLRQGDGLTGQVQAAVPGARQELPARLTPTGRAIESQPLGRFGGVATGDALWDTLNAKGAVISSMSSAKVNNRAATPEEVRVIIIDSGPRIERRLRSALPAIQRMSNEQAEKFVQSVAREERARSRDRLPMLMRRLVLPDV